MNTSYVVVNRGDDVYVMEYKDFSQTLYQKVQEGYDHNSNNETYGQPVYRYDEITGQWLCFKNGTTLVDTFQGVNGTVHFMMRINLGRYDDK